MNDKNKITKENIEKILEFIPYFEDKNNKFYKLSKTDLLYPRIYDRKVNEFVKALYDQNIAYSFDWISWEPEAEKICNNLEKLKSADLDTLRKLLTLHIRKERFCNGHLAHMIKSGHIIVILKRLKEIADDIY